MKERLCCHLHSEYVRQEAQPISLSLLVGAALTSPVRHTLAAQMLER
jgi:hypothetical protein